MPHVTVWFTPPPDPRVAEAQAELYAGFTKNWLAELQPKGPLELEAAHDYVLNLWRKRQTLEDQNALKVTDAATASKLDRLYRHERDFDLRADRALNRLRKLQTERAARTQREVPAGAPPLAAAKAFPKREEDVPALMEDIARSLRPITDHAQPMPSSSPATQTPDAPRPELHDLPVVLT